jgi:WD domain, G-beta repeat
VARGSARLRRGWDWVRKTAHRLFSTRDEALWVEEDALVSRLGSIRNLLGLAVVVFVSFRAGGIHNPEFDPVNRLGFLFVVIVITGVCVVATSIFILPAIKPAARGQVARRLLIPVRTIVTYIGVLAAPFIVGFAGYYLSLLLYRSINAGGSRHLLAVLAVLAFGGTAEIATILLALLALLGGIFSVGSLFRAAEGYPLLEPVAVTMVVWVQLLVVQIMTRASVPAGPMGLILYFGGPITVTALSGLEIVRLAEVAGLDLRGAPPRQPLPRGSSSSSRHFSGGVTLLSMMGGLPVTAVALAVLLNAITPRATGAPVTDSFILPGGTVQVSAISPDGTIVAASPAGGTTDLFSTRTGQITQTLAVPDGDATAMAFSPDSDLLAEAGIRQPGGIPVVYLWNIPAHKLAATLAAPHHGDARIDTLAFSANGTRIAAGEFFGASVYQWNTATGAALSTVPVPKSPGSGTYQLAYLASDTRIGVLTSNGLLLLNAATGSRDPMPGTTVTSLPAGVALAVSPDAGSLAIATGNGITAGARIGIWNLRTMALERTLTVPGPGEIAEAGSLAFNDDGTLLAAGDGGGHVFVWSTATGQVAATLRNAIGYSIGGPPQDAVTIHAAPRSSTLLDQDAYGELIAWNLGSIPKVGAWYASRQ